MTDPQPKHVHAHVIYDGDTGDHNVTYEIWKCACGDKIRVPKKGR